VFSREILHKSILSELFNGEIHNGYRIIILYRLPIWNLE
jgi:hypothetical protein